MSIFAFVTVIDELKRQILANPSCIAIAATSAELETSALNCNL